MRSQANSLGAAKYDTLRCWENPNRNLAFPVVTKLCLIRKEDGIYLI